MKKGLLLCLVALLFVTGCDKNSSSNKGSVLEERNNTNNTEKKENKKNDSSVTVKFGETKEIKSTYGDEEVEVSLKFDDLYISSSVYPPEPKQSFYTYYPEYDGKTYVVVVLDVKNLAAKTLDTDHVFRNFLGDNCTMTVKADGKYEYTSNTVVGLEKNSDGEYDFDKYYNLEPLAQNKLYVFYQVPEEVKDKPMAVNVCLGDKVVNLEK